jgi:hypothetical protein
MSAPAKNKVSIISFDDDAGPKVASCLVDFRHRWETFGAAATVVSRVSTGVGVDSMSGSAVVEDRKVATRLVLNVGAKEDTDTGAKKARKQKRQIFIVELADLSPW